MSAKAIAAARLERQAAKRKNCCARCGQPFGPGEKYTIVAEQHLHLKCYACPFCGASLSGGGGMATPGVGVGYCCQKCHIERYAERCAACNKPLQPGSRVAVHKGRRMHPACFACAVCAKPIDGTFHDHDNGPTCERCYTRNFAPRCAACHVPFKPAEEYVKVKGKALHPSCFGCAVCATPLNIKGFYEKNGAAYCTQHYADKFGSKCALCATPMLSWTQNFHGDKYCSGHDAEMPKCFGCGRLVPDEPAGSTAAPPPAGVPPSGRSPRRALSLQRRSSGADYSDGRSVCKLCVPTAVHDLEAARALFAAVGTFFAGLGAPLPSVERVPLALLDRNSLAGLASSSLHAAGWDKCPVGLTETSSSRRVERHSGRVVDETNDVTQVSCLFGLPKAMLGATLAHEYGHCYLHINGFGVDGQVAEGVCELFAYLWLQHAGAGPEKERRYRVHTIEANPDPTYGGGFRRALAAYYGCSSSLPALLREVKATRRLPDAGPCARARTPRRY